MSHNKSTTATAKNKAILQELLNDEYNKHCADCKISRNPRWASWNLGVFICIRCSGIHRSLGTHISRVKSVDLDSWTDEQTESMVKWGNKRANSLWEANLSARSIDEEKIGGYVPIDGKVESFVRTKYVLGKWKGNGSEPIKNYKMEETKVEKTVPVPVPVPVPVQKQQQKQLQQPVKKFVEPILPIQTGGGAAINTFVPPANVNPNKADLKKSILSLYSTPSTMNSTNSVNSFNSINSNITTTSNLNSNLNSNSNSNSNDPFKNVWM
ncbi:GTPase-activating protein [Pichia kluyveri]|uniref:GTPase-activating protein n=1 Tax=Pichia kluyveri TaxID=36015 RepID=A0AAV5R8K9_PICKL|nr:GTPase-activating protein [Pichia kluyveri]